MKLLKPENFSKARFFQPYR